MYTTWLWEAGAVVVLILLRRIYLNTPSWQTRMAQWWNPLLDHPSSPQYMGDTEPHWGLDTNSLRNKTLWCGTTGFYRDGAFFNHLPQFLIKRFPMRRYKTVDIWCFGCSDGSEALTLIMTLHSKAKRDVHRFLPIRARDVSEPMLNEALAGVYILKPKEMEKVRHFVPHSTLCRFLQGGEISTYRVSITTEAEQAIQYELGDIWTLMETPLSAPIIVLFRNVWYLFEEADQIRLARALFTHLPAGSVLIVGEDEVNPYKHHSPVFTRPLLEAAGFQPVTDPKLMITVFKQNADKLEPEQAPLIFEKPFG